MNAVKFSREQAAYLERVFSDSRQEIVPDTTLPNIMYHSGIRRVLDAVQNNVGPIMPVRPRDS